MPGRSRWTDSRTFTPPVTKISYYPGWSGGMGVPYATVPFAPGDVAGTFKDIDDYTTPQYFSRIKAGEIINNFMAMSIWKREGATDLTWDSGVINHPDGSVWGRIVLTGDLLSMIATKAFTGDTLQATAPTDIELGDSALIEAYAKLKSPQLQGLVSIGELGETLKMLRSPFSRARKLTLRMLSEKRKRAFGRSLRDTSLIVDNIWLEYKYGWKNTLLDCCNAVKAVHAVRQRNERKRCVVRGSRKMSRTRDFNFDQSGFGLWPTLRARGQAVHSVEQSGDAGIIYELPNSTPTEAVARAYGLEARDFGPAVWEMIPYSFVVDWFVSVGPWLQAIIPDPFLNVLGHFVVCKTTDIKKVSNVTLSFHIDSGDVHYDMVGVIPESVSTTDFQYRRMPDRPISPTPILNPNLSSISHATDALALSSQAILSGLRDFKRR